MTGDGPQDTVVDTNKTAIAVEETLHELHQVVEVKELDVSGRDAGPLGQVHPLGWTAIGMLIIAAIFHLRETEWLIGNFEWWHWYGLVAVVAVSIRPDWIKAVSQFLDRVTEFLTEGANSFNHPWAAYVCALGVTALAALFVGPLRGFADWLVGVEVNDIGGGDFEVISSNAGWWRAAIAAVVLFLGVRVLYRLLSAILPAGRISVRSASLMALVGFIITFVVVLAISGWQNGVTIGFAVATIVAALAAGPLWVISWAIFFTIFFYVVSRYTGRFLEASIIIGEVNSLGLQLFGLLALLGVGYGVKAGVNPRIDFWWAEFSNRTKAWLDFVLHVLLFVPFLWMGLRLLHGYSKTNLGFKTDFSGETDGSWPASWHVWETWKQSGDAGNLPVGPVRSLIFVAFVLFLGQILSEMIKGGFVLIRREDLADLKQVDAPTRIE